MLRSDDPGSQPFRLFGGISKYPLTAMGHRQDDAGRDMFGPLGAESLDSPLKRYPVYTGDHLNCREILPQQAQKKMRHFDRRAAVLRCFVSGEEDRPPGFRS